jgi:hypothetical protein
MSDEAKPDIARESRASRARIDRDRRFLEAYFSNGMVICDAELAIHPRLANDRVKASTNGSRRMRRIRQTTEWATLLEQGGLDDFALIEKARELLNAKQVILDVEGAEHIVNDNKTRLGALQTVGKWKGKEKNIVELETGPLEIKVTHDTGGL